MTYTLKDLLDEAELLPFVGYMFKDDIDDMRTFLKDKITKLVTEACGPMEKEPDIILTAEGAEIMGTLMSGAEGRNKMRQQILSVISLEK